eukprot:PhF_6_TR40492/c1_g1_i1/m.60567
MKLRYNATVLMSLLLLCLGCFAYLTLELIDRRRCSSTTSTATPCVCPPQSNMNLGDDDSNNNNKGSNSKDTGAIITSLENRIAALESIIQRQTLMIAECNATTTKKGGSGGGGEKDKGVPCPNQCSGPTHGRCDEVTGACSCKAQWGTKDCSVDMKRKKPEELITALFPGGHSPKSAAEFKTFYPNVAVQAIASTGSKKTVTQDLNSLLQQVTTPFVLIALDLAGWYAESNLERSLDMMLTTDVDVLGGMQVHVARNNLLVPSCWQMNYKRWTLKHRRSPFGYLRHEKFVMYCDRTSNTFLAKTAIVKDVLRGFNASMDNIGITDFFLRIRKHNDKLIRTSTHPFLGSKSPTRLPGYIMVGTHAEVLYLTEVQYPEVFDVGFAEAHQIERLWYVNGTRSQMLCIKTGGILGHTTRGLYAPYCHRYQRQRDFVYLAKLWLDSTWQSPKPNVKYGISLHHGNLFGALRFGTELLWETDGDIDMVAFGLTHDELMGRWLALQAKAKEDGWTTRTTYPEKPWYTSFYHERTDFQMNARSTADPLTRGRPPHIHNLTILYQGYAVHVNGFQNPWEGVRADPGHDYRDHYLAQQGWVPGFTQDSIGCKEPEHNACLPNCNDPYRRLDHNWCSDEVVP